jgi:lipoprotein-anchoring transpeptidase ErfK/SrfK
MGLNALMGNMLRALCGCGAVLWAAGCGTTSESSREVDASTLYEWNGEGLSGPARVVIDLNDQRAYVTLGGQQAGWAVVATGKEGHGTPSGEYTILKKVADKHSNLYGITVDAEGNLVNDNADVRMDRPPPGGTFKFAPMPYWMRLTNSGIGMHAGYIPNPGEPASHGCIRMPPEFARLLFYAVKPGTPVRIVH